MLYLHFVEVDPCYYAGFWLVKYKSQVSVRAAASIRSIVIDSARVSTISRRQATRVIWNPTSVCL